MKNFLIGNQEMIFKGYKLQEYKDNIPNLISRRQFNDRRKKTAGLCEELRKRIAMEMDGGYYGRYARRKKKSSGGGYGYGGYGYGNNGYGGYGYGYGNGFRSRC